jgi:hypothetical protein
VNFIPCVVVVLLFVGILMASTVTLPVAVAIKSDHALSTKLTITTKSLGSGNVGTVYTVFILANKGGGFALDTWRLVSGKLPDGLVMAKSFGITSTVITGVPTTVQTTTFTIEVRDFAGETARGTFSVTINSPVSLVITNQSPVLASGDVGTTYFANLFASGGVEPYVWSIVAGILPPGLRLIGNLISGTPTTSGKFMFTARVSDSRGVHSSEKFSITVVT